MRFRDAKKLDRGDEVILKSNNEPLEVESIEIHQGDNAPGYTPYIQIQVYGKKSGFTTVYHDEVK